MLTTFLVIDGIIGYLTIGAVSIYFLSRLSDLTNGPSSDNAEEAFIRLLVLVFWPFVMGGYAVYKFFCGLSFLTNFVAKLGQHKQKRQW